MNVAEWIIVAILSTTLLLLLILAIILIAKLIKLSKEVEKIVDELMNNAETLAMTKENMIPSVKMYYLIQKLMKANECNAAVVFHHRE